MKTSADRVEVYGNGQLFRQYQLSHAATTLGYDRLISVQESNRNGDYFPAITFQYSNTPNTIEKVSGNTRIYPGLDYETDRIVSGEFDGCGTKVQFRLLNSSLKYCFNRLQT